MVLLNTGVVPVIHSLYRSVYVPTVPQGGKTLEEEVYEEISTGLGGQLRKTHSRREERRLDLWESGKKNRVRGNVFEKSQDGWPGR